jgi:hypothetical protein
VIRGRTSSRITDGYGATLGRKNGFRHESSDSVHVPSAGPTAAQLAARVMANPHERAALERARRASEKIALDDLREQSRSIDRRTPELSLFEIATLLASQLGIDPIDHVNRMRERCRTVTRVGYRAAFCKMARGAGHTLVSIGRFIRRDHAAVLNLLSHPHAPATGALDCGDASPLSPLS